MGREALLTVDCGQYSEKILDIINLLTKIGWSYYDSENNIEYLPLGDDEMYDWQKGNISITELENIINKKQSNTEMVGLCLHNAASKISIVFLARSTYKIIIDLNIDRKTYPDSDITNPESYMQTIILPLEKNGCHVYSICFEDYVS